MVSVTRGAVGSAASTAELHRDDPSEKSTKKTNSIATKFFKGLVLAIPFVFCAVGAVVGTIFGTPLIGGLSGVGGFIVGARVAGKIWDSVWPNEKKSEPEDPDKAYQEGPASSG